MFTRSRFCQSATLVSEKAIFRKLSSPTAIITFLNQLSIHLLSTAGKRLKLTIWYTAGQESLRALTSSYYRGAHGIILDGRLTNLSMTWIKEPNRYCSDPDNIKILFGNKVDMAI